MNLLRLVDEIAKPVFKETIANLDNLIEEAMDIHFFENIYVADLSEREFNKLMDLVYTEVIRLINEHFQKR